MLPGLAGEVAATTGSALITLAAVGAFCYAGAMTEKKPSKPPKDPSEMTPEQLQKLLEGMKKKDPAEKDQKNPPKK